MKQAMRLLQRWFFTGLIVWLPFVGTVILFVWAFNLLDGWVQPMAQEYLGRRIPGLGLAILLATTLAVGALVSNFIGKRLVTIIEAIVERIPAINVVYRFIKDFADTFLNRDKGAFREVVAIQYPREGFWAIGFVTGDVPQAINTVDHESKVMVFLMQAFSPATGTLVVVQRKEIIKLNMDVDEALKMILTGGMVKTPPKPDAPLPEVLSTMNLSR
jgi:uncharacterized membrane protein